eukprot:TRINITY_DN4222_c0_g1_i1.p1 TRINITY_DN4222_c0_g1~~TRINITY_DN4222_c0_g1_i1.p1  ORF type:complete len:539 (+),score=86.22 TRINITY_DN4222_c0_g1_i1:198-1619(+)
MAPYLMVLNGDNHYQIGYDYGYIWGDVLPETYDTFMKSQLSSWWERDAIEVFLDLQWNNYLSYQVPQEFMDELRGIRDGALKRGVGNADAIIARVLTISNFPGDIVKNIEYLLESEALGLFRSSARSGNDQEFISKMGASLRNAISKYKSEVKNNLRKSVNGMGCSYFAIWGNRTVDGKLFSMRNLDWDSNTGINKHKLVTVYKIKGKIPYATVGFAGLVGSLAGISAAGLTVHEAGNDMNEFGETFNGFTWSLRLRYIMENAKDLNSALKIWQSTNNTLGMNHLITSASDLATGHPARALETRAGYTAYFMDNDPREASLKWTDPKTGKVYNLGAPLQEAVWRTNHGYDPSIVAVQDEMTKYNDDSSLRYNILHDSIAYYASVNKKIGYYEAINITSLVGDKGENFFVCPPVGSSEPGTNIMSIMFMPRNVLNGGTDRSSMYVAWGRGSGSDWTAASCNTYLYFDLTSFFTQ